jgi:uncharacterized protein (TIGR00251 family)
MAAREGGAAPGPPEVPLAFGQSAAGVTFAVRVIPRAGRSGIAGLRGDALLVRLAAAPVEGAANDALVELLARALDCPRRDVTILAGHASRDKRIAVAGATRESVGRRLSAILSAR